jgi:hypothetical protein
VRKAAKEAAKANATLSGASSRPWLDWERFKRKTDVLPSTDPAVLAGNDTVIAAQQKLAQAMSELTKVQNQINFHKQNVVMQMRDKLRLPTNEWSSVAFDLSQLGGSSAAGGAYTATKFFESMVHKSLVEGIVGVDAVQFQSSSDYVGNQANALQSRGDEAWYMPKKTRDGRGNERWMGVIGVGRSPNPEKQAVHGLGHWLEANNHAVFEKASLFLDKRVASQPLEMLQTTRDVHHRPNEFAQDGRFPDPYFGRFYGQVDGRSGRPNKRTATEVISMGLEWMYEKPHELARQDPELFDFMYTVLRGG